MPENDRDLSIEKSFNTHMGLFGGNLDVDFDFES